jgi:hypothetical protein
MTMRAALLPLLFALLLAACGGSGEDDTAALSESVKYEVIGGDAFRDDKITVQPDGRASVQTRSGDRSATLTAAELSAVAQRIAEAGLPELDSAVTEPPMPDALSYRFTYRGREVTTDTGKLPDELRPLIGTFNALIERYGA